MPTPALRCFLPMPADHPFSIQNLPYGVFRPASGGSPRVGVAIGDDILDLRRLEEEKLLAAGFAEATTLNAFMAAGKEKWSLVRSTLQRLLSADEPTLRDNPALRKKLLVS